MALFLFCLFCVWIICCYLSAHHAYRTSGITGLLSETLIIMAVQAIIASCVVVGALCYLWFRSSAWWHGRKKK